MKNPRRRNLLIAAAGIAAFPRAAGAQAGRPRKIGILLTSANYPERYAALAAGLREHGWIEGVNLAVERRNADGSYQKVQPLARELVAAGVELIVTNTTQATIEVRKAAGKLPVIAVFADPTLAGLAESLARPGGNVTGISVIFDSVPGKSLELARSVLPKLSHAAFLINPVVQAQIAHGREMQAIAATLGMKVTELRASTGAELDAAFAALAREKPGALIVHVEAFLVGARQRIANQALALKLPSFTLSYEYVQAGCLASYGADLLRAFNNLGGVVDRILKGANPAETPIEQASRLELGLNLRTAKALGIRVPQSVLVRADRVIE
jgi:putative tryptophan/tyrosine transport system substrate-binding protein